MYNADKNSTVKALCLLFLEEKPNKEKENRNVATYIYERHY
jgi:hypothetical protein